MDDDRADGAEGDQGLGDRFQEPAVVDAHELPTGAGGVGQGPQQIEDRGESQGQTHGHGVLRRGMMMNGEAKADAGLFEASRLRVPIGVNVDAELREHLRRASARP